MSSTRSSCPPAELGQEAGLGIVAKAPDPWSRSLLAAAGLLGAAGVALGAASAHLGGGDFARLAAFFLLIHAAALPAILSVRIGSGMWRRVSASLLAIGVVLFSGDLALLGFLGRTPVSGMAPTGGLMLIGGWLVLAVAASTGRSTSR